MDFDKLSELSAEGAQLRARIASYVQDVATSRRRLAEVESEVCALTQPPSPTWEISRLVEQGEQWIGTMSEKPAAPELWSRWGAGRFAVYATNPFTGDRVGSAAIMVVDPPESYPPETEVKERGFGPVLTLLSSQVREIVVAKYPATATAREVADALGCGSRAASRKLCDSMASGWVITPTPGQYLATPKLLVAFGREPESEEQTAGSSTAAATSPTGPTGSGSAVAVAQRDLDRDVRGRLRPRV